MSNKVNKVAKNLLAFGIISSVPTMTNIVVSNANNNLEAEFLSVVDKHDSKSIVVEDGLVIKKDETLNLSSYPNWELSNENTVNISEDGILTPISEGTVFFKMSRYSDTYLSLSQRAKLANSYEGDVFVSIHQNSADVSSANGIETYYHSSKS